MSVAAVSRFESPSKDNYDTWKMHVKALLIENDTWIYVSGDSFKPEIIAGDATSIRQANE